MLKITEAEFMHAREEYCGYCIHCGAERESCEPDAREYRCDNCGLFLVYGAEELLLMGKLDIVD